MATQDPTSWDMQSKKTIRKIQFLIDANHVTVPQVADTIGVPHRTLQDVLDGIAHASEGLIRKCADYFGVTLEFITGQEAPAPKAAPPAHGRATPWDGGKTAVRASATPAPTEKPLGALNVRTVATRHQALVELLIEKGIISARDYHEKVRKVEGRTR